MTNMVRLVFCFSFPVAKSGLTSVVVQAKRKVTVKMARKDELTFETVPIERIGEYVRQQRQKARQVHQKRIQRVKQALQDSEELKDFLEILNYYRSELALANYGADRCMNPGDY